LRVNPALADMQPCTTRKEAEAGNCLVTETLRQEIQKAELLLKPTPAVSMPATPGLPTAAAPATPAVAATAPAAAPVRPLFADRRAVRSAALPQIERKVAVIIGVNDYKDPSIPKLDNAVNDAEVMAALAENELGYETVLIRDATRAQVVAALNRLALALRPQDSVLVYYAGHGDEVASGAGAAKHGYWQLADSDAKRPETWLSNDDIGRLLGSIQASQVALLSDSCYSGTLVSGPKVRAVPGPLDPAAMLSQRTVVVMSSGGNAPVADAGQDGHSPFAHSLFRTLRQVSAWKPGANVFETVRFLVANKFPQTPQYGLSSGATGPKATDYLFEQRKLDAR
jgi:hypothetical protein